MGRKAVPGAHQFALLPNLVPGSSLRLRGLGTTIWRHRWLDVQLGRQVGRHVGRWAGRQEGRQAGQDKANQACLSPSSPSSPSSPPSPPSPPSPTSLPEAILEQLTLVMSGGAWHAILGRTRRMEFHISHLLPWSLTLLLVKLPAPCPCPVHLVIKLPSCPAASKSTKPQRLL